MKSATQNLSRKSIVFYTVYIALISLLLFVGISTNIHADSTNANQSGNYDDLIASLTVPKNQGAVKTQNTPKAQNNNSQQNQTVNTPQKVVAKPVAKQSNNNWFRDGLNQTQLNARAWVAWHESNDHWNILSYGGRCIGYFQMDPAYLGYVHGHVNLNHAHQVKVADRYAKTRYGSWVGAKRFWLAHGWY